MERALRHRKNDNTLCQNSTNSTLTDCRKKDTTNVEEKPKGKSKENLVRKTTKKTILKKEDKENCQRNGNLENNRSVLCDKTNSQRKIMDGVRKKNLNKVCFAENSPKTNIQRSISDYFYTRDKYEFSENKTKETGLKEINQSVEGTHKNEFNGDITVCTKHVPIYKQITSSSCFQLTPPPSQDKMAMYEFEVDENEKPVGKKKRPIRTYKRRKREGKKKENLKDLPERTVILRGDNVVKSRENATKMMNTPVIDRPVILSSGNSYIAGWNECLEPVPVNYNMVERTPKRPLERSKESLNVDVNSCNTFNLSVASDIQNKTPKRTSAEIFNIDNKSRHSRKESMWVTGWDARLEPVYVTKTMKVRTPKRLLEKSVENLTSHVNSGNNQSMTANIRTAMTPKNPLRRSTENLDVDLNTVNSSKRWSANITNESTTSNDYQHKDYSPMMTPVKDYSMNDDGGISLRSVSTPSKSECSSVERHFLQGVTASTPCKQPTINSSGIAPLRTKANDFEVRLSAGGSLETFDEVSEVREESQTRNDGMFGFTVNEDYTLQNNRQGDHSTAAPTAEIAAVIPEMQKIKVQEVIKLLKNDLGPRASLSPNNNTIHSYPSFARGVHRNESETSSLVNEESADSMVSSFTKPPRRSYTLCRRTKRVDYTHIENTRYDFEESDKEEGEEEEARPVKKNYKKLKKPSKKEEKEIERLAAAMNSQFKEVEGFKLCVE